MLSENKTVAVSFFTSSIVAIVHNSLGIYFISQHRFHSAHWWDGFFLFGGMGLRLAFQLQIFNFYIEYLPTSHLFRNETLYV